MRLLRSGQAALEHGLEGASIGVRVTHGLLELHGGAATGSAREAEAAVEGYAPGEERPVGS